jgi:hypothetical protein
MRLWWNCGNRTDIPGRRRGGENLSYGAGGLHARHGSLWSLDRARLLSPHLDRNELAEQVQERE